MNHDTPLPPPETQAPTAILDDPGATVDLDAPAPSATDFVAAPPPPAAAVRHTRQPATPGRIVLLHSDSWDGPRPAVVISSETDEKGVERVTCNVTLDGHRDMPQLAAARSSPTGNTLRFVPLHAPLAREDRELALLGVRGRGGMGFATAIAEWPRRE